MKASVFMKSKILVVCLALLMTIVTVGCKNQDDRIEVCTNLVMTVIEAPNEGVKTALANEDSAEAQEQIITATTGLVGDVILESVITDQSSSFNSSVMALQYQAVFQGITINPTEVSVTQDSKQKNNYNYEAKATLSGDDIGEKSITLKGRIQFNKDGKVDFMTVDGKDFTDIMKMSKK